MVPQKDDEDAVNGAYKQRINLEENGYKKKTYIHNQKETSVILLMPNQDVGLGEYETYMISQIEREKGM